MAASETCSRCGQEVRWGVRHGRTAYWHREDVDHQPRFGEPDDPAELERQWLLPRERWIPCDPPFPLLFRIETYTAAEYEASKIKDVDLRRRRLAELRGQDPDAKVEIPAPEVARHDVTAADFPARSGIRQIHALVEKTPGWDVVRFTACRGPYVGSSGEVLSISDSVVLGARGPQVDGATVVAVASWRDGKFDTAYAGRVTGSTIHVDPVNSTALKSWIKEHA